MKKSVNWSHFGTFYWFSLIFITFTLKITKWFQPTFLPITSVWNYCYNLSQANSQILSSSGQGYCQKNLDFWKNFYIHTSIKRNLRLKWSRKYYQVLLASSTKFHFIWFWIYKIKWSKLAFMQYTVEIHPYIKYEEYETETQHSP